MRTNQNGELRIGFVDVGYARGHTGKVPIECWAPNRLGELSVVTDQAFARCEVVDAWEGEISPREDPSGLDVLLETWALNYDLVVSWNGLFGDYLPLARLSDKVAGILPKSVDLLEQLALDVADMFPEKRWKTAGLSLGKVYVSFGDEFDLGEKYRGDSALDDCMRIFSIYRRLLSGTPLRYDYVAYGGAKKIVEHHAVIAPSERTLAAMRGGPAARNDVRCDLDWSGIALPDSVVELLDGVDETARKPVLRFALQLLAPSVNERVRARLRDGESLGTKDMERLETALERTP
ncbi:hypothetical protein [Brachybacterium saurashtrense]|uniref:Uncharacterized protein n=1 Tax=Brachybacterium saurashtrense TaxID=556288 RepID=A0A345YRS1_9MICO|nr:hypothetical protein [Brachybacterium saurashtrense]AXK46623.1 hypothetical protein DWV08_14055 [Brachybacterium saurashtrense]RRR20749.1 hypothetical protein DXU92_17000 [Brachybacterium saurashtrense]